MQTTYSPEGAILHTPENEQSLSTLDDMRRAMREGAILEAVAARANGAGGICAPGAGNAGECGRPHDALGHAGHDAPVYDRQR